MEMVKVILSCSPAKKVSGITLLPVPRVLISVFGSFTPNRVRSRINEDFINLNVIHPSFYKMLWSIECQVSFVFLQIALCRYISGYQDTIWTYSSPRSMRYGQPRMRGHSPATQRSAKCQRSPRKHPGTSSLQLRSNGRRASHHAVSAIQKSSEATEQGQTESIMAKISAVSLV